MSLFLRLGNKAMNVSGFECCFCKKGIEENKTDPLDMTIVFNEDYKKKTGSFQLLFAHFDCLKNCLHKDNQGYLIKDDEDAE